MRWACAGLSLWNAKPRPGPPVCFLVFGSFFAGVCCPLKSANTTGRPCSSEGPFHGERFPFGRVKASDLPPKIRYQGFHCYRASQPHFPALLEIIYLRFVNLTLSVCEFQDLLSGIPHFSINCEQKGLNWFGQSTKVSCSIVEIQSNWFLKNVSCSPTQRPLVSRVYTRKKSWLFKNTWVLGVGGSNLPRKVEHRF